MKKSSIKAIPPSESSKSLYRVFCTQEEHLPIFVQDWYLDTVCEGGEWNVILLEAQGSIIASWPFFLKKKWTFKYVTMPHFVKWMGIYISPPYDTVKNELLFLAQMLPHLPELDSFKQNFYPSLKNWSSLYWQGFQQSTRYTYQIDLSLSLEEIRKGFNRNITRNIKKAQCLLQVGQDLGAKNFYEIQGRSFQRQNMTVPYSFRSFEKHHQSLEKYQSGKTLYASDKEGNIIAACCIIWDKQRAYYHIAGEHPDFRKTGVGIYLTWKAIEFSKTQLKVPIFDFEGSMLEGVSKIRQQFGGQAIPYHFIYKYNNKLYQLLDDLWF